MGTGGVARAADFSDLLSTPDNVARLDQVQAVVGIEGGHPVAVIDQDVVAIPLVFPGEDHLAIERSEDSGAGGGRQVHALVAAPVSDALLPLVLHPDGLGAHPWTPGGTDGPGLHRPEQIEPVRVGSDEGRQERIEFRLGDGWHHLLHAGQQLGRCAGILVGVEVHCADGPVSGNGAANLVGQQLLHMRHRRRRHGRCSRQGHQGGSR